MLLRMFSSGLCVFLALLGLAAGQAQSNMADLQGVVSDQTGAVLPGVSLTATNVETGIIRTVTTNEEGLYQIPLLPPGSYELRAEFAGFATNVLRGIQLTVGQYANLDITLEVSATETEIFVDARANIVEREKTVQASTITEMDIDNLPINGRNFLDFTLLTPGVTGGNSLQTFASPATPTSGLIFAGQDQRSNYVTIDGSDNVDIISSTVRSTLSQEAIQEFQISRSSYSAEFGRARGGLINIVSKSGTNQFHGNAFFFFRDEALDARNAFARLDDPPFERYQFGGTFGGPIVRDRTFFFAGYERLERDESIFVNFLDDPSIFRASPSQRELFDFLASTGVPSLQFLSASFVDPRFGVLNTLETNFPATLRLFEEESGIFPFNADQDTVSAKIDHQFSANNNFFTRVNFTDAFNDGLQFGALQAVSNGVSFDTLDFTIVAADTHIFSPTTLNDLKFQYGRREFDVATNDPLGPEIILSGVAEFGREFFNPTGYDQNIFQLNENLTMIRGKHTLKTGMDLNIIDLTGFAEVFLGGQFTFGEAIPLGAIIDELAGQGTAVGLARQLSIPVAAGGFGRPDLAVNIGAPISSVQSFNFGLPITYFQGFGDPTTSFVYYQLAGFLQDSWRVSENVTLNLGVRYDVDWRVQTRNVVSQTAPVQFEDKATSDRNNFAPRIGFAWDLSGRGQTVVRGGYGIFYQNFFQAIAFVSQVLSGQISQVFLPLTGIPGLEATSADLFDFFNETGQVGEAALSAFGITPGEDTPSVILPGADNVVNPYSHQASLGIEQRLGQDWALSLDYLFNKGTNLIRSRDVNVRQVGPNQFALPGLDPRFIQINMIETSGSSVYHGFTAALRKRFSRSHSLQVSYTLGKAIDDTTDFITQLQANNQRDLRAERSLSTFDQRHRLVVSGVLQSPYRLASSNRFWTNVFADWTVAPIITAGSGRPFNLLVGFDLNGDTHEETDRPVLQDGNIAGRNTGKGPAFFSTDLRVSRMFHFGDGDVNFEFLFEAFNLFNNVNYSGVNNVVGNLVLTRSDVEGSNAIPANQPLGFTAAFDPRQIQFGFRFNF